MDPNLILLSGAVIMLAGILSGKIGTKMGVPVLLLFLLTGMIFGTANLGLEVTDTNNAMFFGNIALTIILFLGGFETKISDIRPILGPGIVLSTLGVFLTTFFMGVFFWWLSGIGGEWGWISLSLPLALLLSATMSSTDSASVFGILRSQKINLKEGLGPTLELESGSNDPMAYMLTIALIQYIQSGGDGSIWSIVGAFAMQFIIGGGAGYIAGRFAPRLLNKINLGNDSLIPILLLCGVFLVFSATSLLNGNGFLAVYFMGILMGNAKLVHKKSILSVFDGLTWLVQIALFIMLGMYVKAETLLTIAPFALIAGIFMIFVVRPLATFICLAFFPKISFKGKVFLSWVGLRGAVPIIFAMIPVVEQVPYADTFFSIVFFLTLLSLLVQGSTVSWMAKLLGLQEPVVEEESQFDIELGQHMGAKMEERFVTSGMLTAGNRLMDLDTLADNELVILVRRGDNYMVPKGPLELKADDILLIVSEEPQTMAHI